MHGGSAKFSDLYELQEDIGVGSYSICKRCVHRVSAMDYAVKVEQQENITQISNGIDNEFMIFFMSQWSILSLNHNAQLLAIIQHKYVRNSAGNNDHILHLVS